MRLDDHDLVAWCLLAALVAFGWVVGAAVGRGVLRLAGALQTRLRRKA